MVEIRRMGPQIGVEVTRRRRQDDRRRRLCADLSGLARLQRHVRARPGADDPRFHPLQRALRPGRRRTRRNRRGTPNIPKITMLGINKFDAAGKLRDEIYRRGAEGWHTDGAYNQAPFKATQLYALAVPSRGGNTLFANGYAAYDALPQRLKDRLDGVDRRVLPMAAGAASRGCSIPRTRIGRRSITRSSASTPRPAANRCISIPARSSISSASTAREGDELIAELKERMIAPDAEYHHEWRKGRHRDLGQSLLVSQGGRRLPARGGPHPLAGLDQRFRRPRR